MLHKSFEILEAKADAEAGTFEATVAVFGNIDKGGDRIMPGAFDKTLAKWRETGDPIPIILSHSWDNPFHHIGVADPNDVTPTTKGLHVKGKLDVADNDVARQVHRLMQRRSLKEFSFGYSVPKGGERRAKDGANDLLEIDLAEVGPTLKGMNPETELHAVKSALTETRLEQELQEVKARLDTLEKALEDRKNTVDVTGKETKSRPVDPLSKQAQELALEVRSGGLSKQPPIKQAAPEAPKVEPGYEPDDLRRYSRDLMVQVLSGTEET